jgi:hypothetical protein
MKNHMANSHPDCKEVAGWDAEKSKKKKKRKVPVHNGDEPADVGKDREANHQSAIVCLICEHQGQDQSSDVNDARTFPHLQALLDHQRAKHFGSHSQIKPDWCHDNDNASLNYQKAVINEKETGAVPEESTTFFGNCSICGVSYSSKLERMLHDLEFIPTSSTTAATETTKGHSKSTESASCDVNKNAMQPEQYNLPTDENLHPVLNWKCTYCNKLFRNVRDRLQHENFCSTKHIVHVKPYRLCR